MRRAIRLMTGIVVAALAVCLATSLQAQESGESSERPPVRVAVVKPKDAAPEKPRIRVRLVTAEQAGLPVTAFTAGENANVADTGAEAVAASGAVDILVGAPQASAPPAGTVEPGQDAPAGSAPSLFDQLVAPSWSGGGGFDRAPWPEENRPSDPAPVSGAGSEATNVVVASSPSPSPSPAAVRPAMPTPGVAGSGQPGSLAPVASGDYRLGPGDRVDVFVWRNAELSRVVPVRPDGRITLPLAGEVVATGKTVAMLQEEITARLSDYVQMPTVTVTLAEIRSLVVYVLGDVRTPGAVQMDRNLTVLQAIAAAGGLNEFADRNDIVVMRTNADGVHQRWSFRYDDVVEGKQLSSNIVLQAGDTIIVP